MTETNPYREPETTLPMLVTLAFSTPTEAHELIESIKKYGGVLVPSPTGPRVSPCSVTDFRRWGGETMVFGPKWPNHPEVKGS